MLFIKEIIFFLISALCFIAPSQASSKQVNNIVILESGRNSSPEIEDLNKRCALFKPTVKQIENFFLKADLVPRRFGEHERWSSCYASGTAYFNHFGIAEWTIRSGGTGSIEWSEDENAYFFHKSNGWFDPTACTYGLGGKGEC
ncbi:hypothetical protein [Comamonas composti]|uniref:hypothetical protein n=1 Tax=Comamonas composti TaxID=408558 RepID=UPI0012EBF033|nr:hypothetical protein [Comamonas composti]